MRARLTLSFAAAVTVALLAFGGATIAVLNAGDRDEAKAEGRSAIADETFEDARRVLLAMALAAPVAIGGAAALGFWLAKRAVAPLREASARARAARASFSAATLRPAPGASSFNLTLPVSGSGDEWDELAVTLNGLLEDGRASLDRIRRFTADAAHELRTPLTAIIGESEVALRRERSNEELRASLQVVQEESSLLAAVLEALLTLARGDQGTLVSRRSRQPLLAMLREAATEALARTGSLAVTAGAIEFEEGKGDDLEVSCDRVLVVQALRNLLENGLRHGGGRVFVRTRRAGERACVRIEDRGSGIPPDLLPLLFHRFARADLARSDGGLGLGLSLARAIIEAHGGTLELVPSKSGAAFELELPIEPASPT